MSKTSQRHLAIVQLMRSVAANLHSLNDPSSVAFWQALKQDPFNQAAQSINIAASKIDPDWTLWDGVEFKMLAETGKLP